jgi:DNA mismatch repair protein MutS2
MSDQGRDVALFLNRLEERIHQATAEAEELCRRQRELEAREKKLADEMARREAARLREIDASANEARRRFDEEAKAAIENLLAVPEQRKAAERALRQVARAKREFTESVESLSSKDQKRPPAPPADALQEGSRVRLRDVSQPARVRKVLPGDVVEVDVGILKMQVPRSDIVEVLPGGPAVASILPKGVTFTSRREPDTLTREINIIGRKAEDALEEVDKFLDAAYMASVVRVRVIHGHGMGILRKTVHNLCKAHPHVAKFYLAGPSEGGNGATIIEMRED